MPRLALTNRAGFTLTEVLIALTIASIIGASATGALIHTSKFYDQQEKLSAARQVSRSATNILMSELRMVEVSGGVIAASADSITVRLPYAMGLVCGSNAANNRTVVSMLPVDSAVFAHAGSNYSGWARRSGVGPTNGYAYATATPRSITATSLTTPCTNAAITTITGGRVLELQPHVSTAVVGTPMFLYQTITYKFAPSGTVPGTRALWRRVLSGTGGAEELIAPYTDAARFRFYIGMSQTPSDTPPGTLSNLRGVEIVLTGRSERRVASGVSDEAELTTAVFFRNRLD